MAVSAITNAFAGKSAPSSGAGWWEPILNIGANILGNVAGAALANDGIDDQNDAVRDANNASIALNRDVFNTNLALAKPFYQGSGNAFNMLANISGMPAQDFSFPTVSNSGGSYGGGPSTVTLQQYITVQGNVWTTKEFAKELREEFIRLGREMGGTGLWGGVAP